MARTIDWNAVIRPRYLRFAVPGLVLVAVATFTWADGWWPHVARLAGLALIIWPLPSRARNQNEPGTRRTKAQD